MIERNTFSPDWLSSPGETMEDILEEKGWTKKEFAERTGYTTKHINELTNGRAQITAETAERIARVLGSTAQFWLTRDAHYQAALEHQRAIRKAKEDADWLKELPLSWMKKQGWVRAFQHRGEQVLECLRFFGVHSVDAWRQRYPGQFAAFRSSPSFEKKEGAVAAWLRKAEQEATDMRCAPFDKQGFQGALAELRSLTRETAPSVFAPKLQNICSKHGVAVVFVAAPTGCPASGATKWLTPEKAMLVLSLRYKTNDHFWFTFFHEAAHILKHGKKLLAIEGVEGMDAKLEGEADRFARDVLIPRREAQELYDMSNFRFCSKKMVSEFAEKIGVAPGIVVGRMQNEGWLPWSHMNALKVKYEWIE
ncbi:helix-turn-helix domain-containing protein [Bradymonadaceae bacterium TMQ3]|nr:helix-turn-helix domain-containing protein [Bradymonadaceae bacterium TMQ3]TXC75461.1 helix-turn-helix domain-containing protein [Bradymonadales bacterium TMQ1]